MSPPLMKITTKHHKHLNNPFPSPPPSTPLLHGTLFSSLPSPQLLPIGHHFHLSFTISNGSPSFSISHSSTPKKQPLWSSLQGESFVSGSVVETEVEESRGSFAIRDGGFLAVCNHQMVDDIRVFHSPEDVEFGLNFDLEGIVVFPVCVVSGLVFGNERCRNGGSIAANYSVLFAQKGDYQVGFEVRFGEIIKHQLKHPNLRWNSDDHDYHGECNTDLLEFNRVFLTHRSEEDERFFGFGEQFSHVEFKGKRVPIFVQEQGIGRGDQPITFAANLVSYRAGGDSSTTYAPSPFYMTSKMRSLYLEGYDYSIFDLTKSDRVQIQIHNRSAKGRILHGNSPSELIERFTATTGRPPKLPNWIISGAVVGMQGGTEAVRRVWNQLQDHNIPVSSFWLQDWVGQRKTMIGSQLWWNWELDSTHYSGWSNLVRDLSSHNIKVMAYCNPCLAPVNGKSNKTRDMFSEASNLGILVENRDGSTYMVPNTAFDVGMLDFTNPLAVKWFKKILQQMVDCGIRGWMADFGEGLPLDATLHSGEDPITAHNRYPELWARVNREFVDEWKSNRDGNEKEDPDESLVFFTRAGFRGNSKWAMLFWEGDQMVSWQKNDGIKSSVVGLLSSGLSGLAFNHSDIGGYCTANLGFVKYRRSEELLIRWMELNAFSTVFRSHEGNKPSYNSQFYSNNNTLSHFSRCANIYKAWLFYRIQLVEEAAQKGLPVARHLFLHYPNDEHVWNLSYEQFMIGAEIMVAPVLDKGMKKVKVYFPVEGGSSWKHVWSGNIFGRPSNFSGYKEHGFEEWVEAPIGFPAVFVKVGSVVGETFLKNLRDLDVL